ncbi:Uma2 family endonuclease [Rhodocaloribacter litoris]|uniref:Uma2 family endonuclease n=1 Tax=Rhodocaloribacter litoris TaxID=2558931 RepID=UPI00141FD35E|nr:Uma2 family endonuclease [Rhodocaloribacter litoris]QXD15914.1 Uma2 family endonuclease [Rhodocaloribacter litoris]
MPSATTPRPGNLTSGRSHAYPSLPEGAAHQAAELIEGAVVVSPPPTPYHQEIVMNLGVELFQFARKHDRGKVLPAPVEVRFSETNVLQPDLLYIARERLRLIGEQRIEGVPDLVVEVLSPATAYYDLRQKKRIYEQAGVKEYWIVDPMEQSIELFLNASGQFAPASRAEGTGAVTSKLLEGFTIELKVIF